MPRDAVSRTANVGTWLRKRNGGHKWVKEKMQYMLMPFDLPIKQNPLLSQSLSWLKNQDFFLYCILISSSLPKKENKRFSGSLHGGWKIRRIFFFISFLFRRFLLKPKMHYLKKAFTKMHFQNFYLLISLSFARTQNAFLWQSWCFICKLCAYIRILENFCTPNWSQLWQLPIAAYESAERASLNFASLLRKPCWADVELSWGSI